MGCSMFERERHRRVAEVLQAFDVGRLQDSDCYFGGGTAIVMLLGEYRESVDIDFMCASGEGYRRLRNTVTSTDLGPLLKTPLKYLREVRTNEYKVFTIFDLNDLRVKVEFVYEARVPLVGALNAQLGVPVLVRDDLYAEKLLANADRGLDRAVLSRDVIDLAMMMQGWGDIPETAWHKVLQAYGKFSRRVFHQAIGMVSEPAYLGECLGKMRMDAALVEPIQRSLDRAAAAAPLDSEETLEQQSRIARLLALAQGGVVASSFHHHAARALASAGSPKAVDWSAVERDVIHRSLAEGADAQEVRRVICADSPGAVAMERRVVIEHNIERLARQYEWRGLKPPGS